jgi:E3 ubiquitin-protein ligase HERC3
MRPFSLIRSILLLALVFFVGCSKNKGLTVVPDDSLAQTGKSSSPTTTSTTPIPTPTTSISTNTAPTAETALYDFNAGNSQAITLRGTDADGDPLTFAIAINPSHGTLSGTPPNVTYTPAANYHGSDAFTFRVNDSKANSAPATISLVIRHVNHAPVIAPVGTVTALPKVTTSVFLSVSDPDNNSLTYSVTDYPDHGTLLGTGPSVSYTPATNYSGTDSFRISVSDGDLSTAVTVNLVVPYAPMVAGGLDHTCALSMSGVVKCWGDNFVGQLGNGAAPGAGISKTPVSVDLGTGRIAKSLASGYKHTCAILDNGSLACWGLNSHGQLGNGNTTDSSLPVLINLGANRTAKAVATGDIRTCAILDDNSLKCWGSAWHNQVVEGGAYNMDGGGLTPQPKSLGTRTAKAIQIGNGHACAILDNDSVACWGYNGAWGIGDGTTKSSSTPVLVNLGGKTAKAIDVKYAHSCAILSDDSVKCWGSAVLGGGAPSPADISLGAGRTARALATGYGDYCALLDDSSVRCWGYNVHGEMGQGNTTSSLVPQVVNLGAGSPALAIAMGWHQVCAVLSTSAVKCWGKNTSGQLGLGDLTHRGDNPNEMGDFLPAVDLSN